MNERIKELARMSGFTVDETGTFPEFAEMTRLDCFAELIVAEVLAVQEKFIADGHNAWHLNKPTREHFGVEE